VNHKQLSTYVFAKIAAELADFAAGFVLQLTNSLWQSEDRIILAINMINDGHSSAQRNKFYLTTGFKLDLSPFSRQKISKNTLSFHCLIHESHFLGQNWPKNN